MIALVDEQRIRMSERIDSLRADARVPTELIGADDDARFLGTGGAEGAWQPSESRTVSTHTAARGAGPADMVDEWGYESFPASDAPPSWNLEPKTPGGAPATNSSQ